MKIEELIVNLLVSKLGVEKKQYFKFIGQKNKDNKYYFSDNRLMKVFKNGYEREANVRVNYLLDEKIKVIKLDEYKIV